MLCWKWTTSQVSGSGKSPNTLLTEITDRALIVTQPQSQLQTTIGACLAQPASLQTHLRDFHGGPWKGFPGFGKNYCWLRPFPTARLCLCS